MEKLRAFCDSPVCGCDKKNGSIDVDKTRRVEKTVSRFKWFCPDCGYALFWQRGNKRKFTVVEAAKFNHINS